MTQQVVTVPGQLDKIETMKDRSVKMVFYTKELKPEDAGKLHGIAHNYGWCVFAPEELYGEAVQAVPKEKPPKEHERQKSNSERIWNVTYVLWEKLGRPGNTHKEFYDKECERIMIEFKERIRELEQI